MADLIYSADGCEIWCGDCRAVMAQMPDNSVDSIVTDPPYGLSREPSPKELTEIVQAWATGQDIERKTRGFMGKTWDAFVPGSGLWTEALRVLKPGGHLVAFAGTRTVDVMGLAIRLAGFEIRDQLQWLYGSGFPKSLDVSKAIDGAAGVERVGGFVAMKAPGGGIGMGLNAQCANCEKWKLGSDPCRCEDSGPSTDLAKQYQGYGTALKPAVEPIVLARKPLSGTVAANVREWGTGGINVDGCRVGYASNEDKEAAAAAAQRASRDQNKGRRVLDRFENGPASIAGFIEKQELGRWPANIVLDEVAAAVLDDQAGNCPGMSGGGKHKTVKPTIAGGGYDGNESHIRGDDGGPSRFFYTAKTSRFERDLGLGEFDAKTAGEVTGGREDGSAGLNNPRAGAGRTSGGKNIHPTVKPISLMRWLVRLVTPKGGKIFDPFTGSGSTGCAAVIEGFEFVGAELGEDHAEIAAARVRHCVENPLPLEKPKKGPEADPRQIDLFGGAA